MSHWASHLIGRPWKYGAQGPDEFDCWGFVRYVQQHHFNVQLPAIPVPDSLRAAHDLLICHEEHVNWYNVPTPIDGDIVMMARRLHPVHVGVALTANGYTGVLHCFDPSGVVYQSLPTLKANGWGRLSYYRRIA